jgi:hypothetical protein
VRSARLSGAVGLDMRAGLADDPTVQLLSPLLCAQTAVVQTERDQNGRTRKVCSGIGVLLSPLLMAPAFRIGPGPTRAALVPGARQGATNPSSKQRVLTRITRIGWNHAQPL